MEESTCFRQQRETPSHFSWNCPLWRLLCCPTALGAGSRMSPVGPKSGLNMSERRPRPWSVKGWSDLRTTRPRCSWGPWGNDRGLKSTEGRSFKCNGFQWLKCQPVLLEGDVSTVQCNSLQLLRLSRSQAVWRNGVALHLAADGREIPFSVCMLEKLKICVHLLQKKWRQSPKHNRGNGEIKSWWPPKKHTNVSLWKQHFKCCMPMLPNSFLGKQYWSSLALALAA